MGCEEGAEPRVLADATDGAHLVRPVSSLSMSVELGRPLSASLRVGGRWASYDDCGRKGRGAFISKKEISTTWGTIMLYVNEKYFNTPF